MNTLNNIKNKKPEILSPCGSRESLEAALRSGADAVYLGGEKFSARKNAKNFTREELLEAVKLCHRYGVSVYQAINTVVTDSELLSLADEIEYACKIGIDGLIIQDRAVERIVRELCPDMPIHASTQATLHTENGVIWAKEHGYSRTVLSRELPLDLIKKLSNLGTETEIFVHGAICMSVSGQCYLSAVIGGRSANRGLCAGACRLPFSADGKANVFSLSLKDMCLADYADKLIDSGASSLKIEGRMKRPEYVAASADAMRSALDGKTYDRELLRSVFSRSGFTDGYFTGERKDMFGVRTGEDAQEASGALPKIRELYRRERQKFPLTLRFTAYEGESIALSASDGYETATVYGGAPQKALNRPTEPEAVKAQLSKLGGTLYFPENISVSLGEGLMIPLSQINSMRQEAAEKLDDLRVSRLTKIKSFKRSGIPSDYALKKRASSRHINLRAQVQSVSQLDNFDFNGVDKVIIPLAEAKKYLAAGYPADKAILELPRFTFCEENVIKDLLEVKDSGFYAAECQNCAHINILKNIGMKAVGGFGLNITNSLSAGSFQRTV